MHASYRCCITHVFHRFGYYREKHNVVLLNFINFQRKFSKFTILNSNLTNDFMNLDYKKNGGLDNAKISNAKDPEEKFFKDVKLRLFNEKVKEKLKKDSLHYNIFTENLHKFRNNPLEAFEIYTNIVKNGLLNCIKSHHIRMFLQIICYNPNKKTFEWLIQIMKDFHSFNLKNRIPSDVYKMTLHKMVDLSNNSNLLSEILDAIAEKNAFYGRADAYQILVKIYCEQGNVKDALYILRQVILFGQIPRKGLYNILIHELCKQGKLEIAEELLEEFEEYLDTPNIFLYTSLISGYSKKGEIDKVENFFKKLLELGIQPDKKLYTTLIFAYLRHGDTHRAYKFYKQIIEQNIKHDIYLFVSQIYTQAINSNSVDAKKLFEKMKTSGIIPNAEAYNHLIYAYSQDNSIGTLEIENLYLQMFAEGIKPNHYTYELLINAMCKRHSFLKASKYFNEMRKNNSITNVALNPIIRYQTLLGNMDLALKLYRKMVSIGIEPNLHIYTSIISLATISSKHLLAIKVFKELLAEGYKPNVYIYSALITSLVKAKKPQVAIKIFQQMVKDNVSLNHIPFTALIQSFVMTKRFEEGKKLYELMKKMNLKIDRFVYYHFEKLIKQSKHKKDLEYLYEDMKRNGIDPNSHGRIYTKGKGPSYWRLKFLAQRRILRQNLYKMKKKPD